MAEEQEKNSSCKAVLDSMDEGVTGELAGDPQAIKDPGK